MSPPARLSGDGPEVRTRRLDTKATKRLLRRLLKRQGCAPRRMVTDKLGSHTAAQIMLTVEHARTKVSTIAELSFAPRPATAGDAGLPVTGRLAEVRRDLLSYPQPPRSNSFRRSRPCDASASPYRDGRMESRSQHRRLSNYAFSQVSLRSMTVNVTSPFGSSSCSSPRYGRRRASVYSLVPVRKRHRRSTRSQAPAPHLRTVPFARFRRSGP